MTDRMEEVSPHIFRVVEGLQPAGGYAIKAMHGWVSLEAIRLWAEEGRSREQLAADCLGASLEAIDAALSFSPDPSLHCPASEEAAVQEFLDTWTAPEGLEEDLRALLDRVSRERTRQALERAAKLCEKNRGREGWIAMAAAIRGLSDGESVASEEK